MGRGCLQKLCINNRDSPGANASRLANTRAKNTRLSDKEYLSERQWGTVREDYSDGNSNWRGPIWMPVNALIIRSLLSYYSYYGDDFQVECPTGSGQMMTLYQVAEELSRRLSHMFVRDEDGRRAVFGGAEKFQNDPHWRDNLLFYEYFHGDNGAGLGASHQTGWTGVIARAMHLFATTTSEQALKLGKMAAVVEVQKAPSGQFVGAVKASGRYSN